MVGEHFFHKLFSLKYRCLCQRDILIDKVKPVSVRPQLGEEGDLLFLLVHLVDAAFQSHQRTRHCLDSSFRQEQQLGGPQVFSIIHIVFQLLQGRSPNRQGSHVAGQDMEEMACLSYNIQNFWSEPFCLQEHAAGEQRHVKKASVPLLESPLEEKQPCADFMLVKNPLNLSLAFSFFSWPYHQAIVFHSYNPRLHSIKESPHARAETP